MVSAVLWSFYLQSKHRGLCCSPHNADGWEMMAEMLLFSLLFREPLSQPLKALFEADREHSKREKLLDSHAKTFSSPPFFVMHVFPFDWANLSMSACVSIYLSIYLCKILFYNIWNSSTALQAMNGKPCNAQCLCNLCQVNRCDKCSPVHKMLI